MADPLEIAAAKGIVTDLGGHPLALELAAASMESYAGMTTFAEYRQMLADPGEDALKLAEEFVDLLPNGHEKSIAATMHHSLKQLGEEGLDFLRLAAQLSPAPIPASVVFSTFAHVDGLEEAKAKLRAAQAFNQTEKHSLSQVVEPQQGLRIVHALVSRVIRFDGEHTPRSEALRAAVVQTLNAVLPEVTDIRNHRLLEHQVSHARELVKQMVTEDDAALGGWVARHDDERGDYSSARIRWQGVLVLRQTLLGEEHSATLDAINNLAETLRALGNFHDARALHEKGLVICLRMLGEEHPNTLTSMINLSGTLREQGVTFCAQSLLEESLDICLRVLGEEHPTTLVTMNNLAATLRVQGEFLAARALLEKELEFCRRVHGEEHPNTLASIDNLAGSLRELGELSEARDLLEKNLEIRRRVLGEEHPITLVSMSNLAVTLREQGKFLAARALQQMELEICRRVLGIEHPETTISAFNLYCMLMQGGEQKVAAHIFQFDLAWLLKRDPTTLGAVQRNIREQLEKVVKSRKAITSKHSSGKKQKRKKK